MDSLVKQKRQLYDLSLIKNAIAGEINCYFSGEIYIQVKCLVVIQYISGYGGRANYFINNFFIEQSDCLFKVIDIQQAYNLNSNI